MKREMHITIRLVEWQDTTKQSTTYDSVIAGEELEAADYEELVKNIASFAGLLNVEDFRAAISKD